MMGPVSSSHENLEGGLKNARKISMDDVDDNNPMVQSLKPIPASDSDLVYDEFGYESLDEGRNKLVETLR